nr:GntR family transcriptional regulator [Rhodospirillales bacterium]
GARVTINQLAGRYGASHMPIREALRQLQGEGLLVLEQNRGARVRSLDRPFVVNMFETRSAIEVVLARQAARDCTAAQLAELQTIEADRHRRVADGDFPAALAINRRFHQLINAAAHNPQAVAIVDQHWVLIAALWHRYGYGPERFAGVSSDHRNLLRALSARDIEATAAIMNAHVIKAKYDLLERMDVALGAAAAAVA